MNRIALLLFCLTSIVVGCKDKEAYPKPKGALRVVQYNVGVFSKEIDNSIPMVAAMMREIQADALSINELDSCNLRHANYQLADLAAEMGGWNHKYSRAMPYLEGAYGVGIAVPDEILSSSTIALPKDSGSEPRACCVVETPRYVLASTHLDYLSQEAALLQARTITEALMVQYGDSKKPVILAGDFNSAPDSEVIKYLSQDWKILSVKENTYPSHEANECIDFIMSLNNKAKIKVLGSGVPTEFKSGDVAIASDHLPVYLDIRIK